MINELIATSAAQPIVVFPGTFDPPHKGHLDAMLTAIIRCGAKAGIFIADKEPNGFKQRQAWEIRTDLLHDLVKEAKNLYVSPWNKEEIVQFLSTAHLIFLIGADMWDHFKVKPLNPYYKQVCISGRKNVVYDNPTYPIPVVQIHPAIDYCSSTHVRRLLTENEASASEHLTPYVYAKIKRNFLYLSSDQKRKGFEDKIQLLFENTIKFVREKPVVKCLTKDGLSQDMTFAVYHGRQPYAFVKAFIYFDEKAPPLRREAHPVKRMEQEWRAMRKLQAISLHDIEAPRVRNLHWGEFWGLMVQDYISHPDLRFHLKVGNCASFISMGRALRRLHDFKRIPANSLHFVKWTDMLKSQIQTFQCSESDRTNCLNSLKKYAESEEYHAYVHGDANLGNFMKEVRLPHIYFVDLNGMGTAMNIHEEPRGYAGYEVFQFISSVHFIKEAPLEFKRIAIDHFLAGYQIEHGALTKEAKAFTRFIGI